MTCSNCIFQGLVSLALLCTTAAVDARDISKDTPSHQVRCWTTKGRFTLDIHKNWAPNSAKHFVKLVKSKYYDDQLCYNKIPNVLLSMFGQHFDLKTRAAAQEVEVAEDADMGVKFAKGMISLASARNTVVFIADEGSGLGDKPHERPFGIISEGMDNVMGNFHGYPEGSFQTNYTDGVERFIHNGRLETRAHFPHLDVIVACRTSKSEEYGDEHHAKAVEEAIAVRQELVDATEAEVMKAWYHHPSKKTVPQKYVEACEKCEDKDQVFVISMLACANSGMAMSPSDEIDGKTKECSKKTIFKGWPASFQFPSATEPKVSEEL